MQGSFPENQENRKPLKPNVLEKQVIDGQLYCNYNKK